MAVDPKYYTMGSKYVDFRSVPSNDETTDGMWCAERGYRVEDLNAWKSQADWAPVVLRKRRERYAEQMSEVDAALLEKAKSGDTKAAELLYRRFEGWTPKANDEALKKNPAQKTFTELIGGSDVE